MCEAAVPDSNWTLGQANAELGRRRGRIVRELEGNVKRSVGRGSGSYARSLSCNTLTRGAQVRQPEVWIGTIEISWTKEETPNVFQPAFTVVTTWAADAEEFREKCILMLESYGWKLLGVERASPVPENGAFSEELEDMLQRTRGNPNAIIYGTFYSYPVM